MKEEILVLLDGSVSFSPEEKKMIAARVEAGTVDYSSLLSELRNDNNKHLSRSQKTAKRITSIRKQLITRYHKNQTDIQQKQEQTKKVISNAAAIDKEQEKKQADLLLENL